MGGVLHWGPFSLGQAVRTRTEKGIAAVFRFAIMRIRGRGEQQLLESNEDRELAELGNTPPDVRAIVARTLGDRPLTLSYADELLDALSHRAADGDGDGVPGEQREQAAQSRPPVLREPAPEAAGFEEARGRRQTAMGVAPPVFAEGPPPVDVPPLFDSQPAPPILAAPLFDARPANVEPPPVNVFDAQEEEERAQDEGPRDDEQDRTADASSHSQDEGDDFGEPQTRPPGQRDPESTAQAIEAAFDIPESDLPPRRKSQPEPRDTVDPVPAVARQFSVAPSLELGTTPPPRVELGTMPPPRREWGGSRRPDLDRLLDQPLDALDFERSDPPEAPTTPPAAAAPSAPPSLSSGDDCEILGDDEILEIAEDDVEMMDDDKP